MLISLSKPSSDLQEAVDRALASGEESATIELGPGRWRLNQPIVISGPTQLERLSIIGSDRQQCVLCGSVEIRGAWEPWERGISRVKTEPGLQLDMLYVDGRQYHMARYPKYDPSVRILQGYAPDCISPERVARWANPAGGYFHALHIHRWGDFHYRITGKDAQGNLTMEGGTQNNRRLGLHEEYRYVENVFEELTAPGEWYHDREQGWLYVFFQPGSKPGESLVEGVVNDCLIKVVGQPGRPILGVSVSNLTFTHTSRTFMKVEEPLLRSDWCIYRGGALHFENTANCSVSDCDLVDLGSNALCVNGWNREFAIRSSLIRDIGGSGICFIGAIDSVRSPLFEYAERHKLADLDLTPGPATENYPCDCQVDDCLITRTGKVEKQTAGVQISMSRRIRVSRSSIYDLPRAAINISEGNFGGHILEECDIFDTVLETGDHGSFNAWGRDRYWELEDVDLNDLPTLGLAHLPFLDVVEPNIIRSSRWRCDWGWDIDLDDGSSNYEIYNNLCLRGGIKTREGYGRIVRNNIIVGSGFSCHVPYPKPVGDIFIQNILWGISYRATSPVLWGGIRNANFFHNPESTTVSPARNMQGASEDDGQSLYGNAQFVNPVQGNFAISGTSPALRIGFRNFEMEGFGVVSERLRKIAGAPRIVLPQQVEPNRPLEVPTTTVLGAKGRPLLTSSDLSATGMFDLTGFILIEVPPSSKMAKMGYEPGDVILEINGKKVHESYLFTKLLDSLSKGTHETRIMRDQKEKVFSFEY